MAQDYRKKSSSSRQARSAHLLMPVVLAFLFGYLCASLFNFHQLTKIVSGYVATSYTPKPSEAGKPLAELPKPKFEFYSLLASDHSANTAVTESKTVKKPEVTTAVEVHQSKARYLLQVASFKSSQDAERLKASLLLKGYDVAVTSVATAQTTWYRVNLGPFQSISLAEKAQGAIVASEKVMGIIRKIEG